MRVAGWLIPVLVPFLGVPPSPSQEQEEVVSYRLFAATDAGPLESHDWGERWFPVREGLPRAVRTFYCIGPRAFAGGAEGLYVSNDSGKSWSPVDGWEGGEVRVILPSSYFGAEPVVFAGTGEGLHRSRDGGGSWQRVGDEILRGAVHDLAWPGPALFATTSRGIYRSDDGGTSWLPKGKGLPETPLLSLALSRFFGQDPVAFVGTDGAGVFRSRDGCESFHSLRLAARSVYDLFWWESSLFAGTEDGLFVSQDAGESWKPVSAELKGLRVRTIWVPAPEARGGSDILLGTDRGSYKSSDGGLTWRHLTRGMGSEAVFGFGSFPITVSDTGGKRRW